MHIGRVFIVSLAAACLAPLVAGASTVTIFFEDFEGYTSFPAQIPAGDPVNPGLPLISEGAKETWYGGRFYNTTSQSSSNIAVNINEDLAVQKVGGGSNNTKTGRMEDGAGLLFNISTVGLSNIALDFDWRTFSAGSTDRLKAGYYVGNINFGTSMFHEFRNNTGTNGPTWDQWTQFLSDGPSNTWKHVTQSLPAGAPSLWVAFWFYKGEGDYAKVDNIKVTGWREPAGGQTPIPLPAAAWMGLAGLGMLVGRRYLGSR